MNYYISVLKNYATFTGRARRAEYWMFFLFNFIISIVLSVIASQVPTLGILSMIYSLAVLIPGIAVSARRMHDTGRSGWWLLLALTGIGAIVILVFAVMDSQEGDNEYGPNPKA